MYRIVFLVLSSICILGGCMENTTTTFRLPYYNDAEFTPIFILNKNEVAQKIPHTISNFSFLNQNKQIVDQKRIDNKIHVANFIFTSCGSICPIMTQNMKLVSDSIGRDTNLVFLSFSVTPWIDKPNILKLYKERNKINNNNWEFLTGAKSEIYQLARKSYFAEEAIGFSKDSSSFLHTEHFILVDKTKRIRGIYNGTLALEMHQLIDDIYTLQKEN